ncbi:MAG: hypothetical protein AAF708_11485 [Deinococcota bacterium]
MLFAVATKRVMFTVGLSLVLFISLGQLGQAQTRAQTRAQTNDDLPECYLLLQDLSRALNQAYEVTSTVNISTGGYELAYNRSRFSRHGDEITVTLLEQRGRRTNYDQDVLLNSGAARNPDYLSEQASDEALTSSDQLLPFDCLEYSLQLHPDALPESTSSKPAHAFDQGQVYGAKDSFSEESSYYLLELANTTDIPVDRWRLTFRQQENWYVLEHLWARFEMEILFIPVRGSFYVSFTDWDLPARLPVSPRERLSQTLPTASSATSPALTSPAFTSSVTSPAMLNQHTVNRTP